MLRARHGGREHARFKAHKPDGRQLTDPGFAFADGHSEIKKWKDGRSFSGQMVTTYTRTFNYGQLQSNNPDIQWVQDRTTAKIQ